MEPIKYLSIKGKNKRMQVVLIEDKEGNKAFRVATKTLKDFKTRNISETDNLYSIETFIILQQAMYMMANESEVKNKLIIKELSKIGKFTASGNLKTK